MKDVINFSIFIVLALLCLYGCNPSAGKPRGNAFPVTVDKVQQRNVPIYIETIGNIYSFSIINVKPQVSGIIVEAHVAQGQEVETDDLLFTINPQPYEAQLEKAKGTLQKDIAALEFAQKRVERYANLVEKDYVSRLTYEEYLSNVDGAKGQIVVDESDVALAQINLNYCYVRAPINGKISEFNVFPGNFVRPEDTTPLTVIRQIDPADVHFTLTQRDFDALKITPTIIGREFELYLPDLPKETFNGKIYFVDNNIDVATGTILLKGEIPNEKKILWPGQFVRIKLLVRNETNALLVPFTAVEMGQHGNYVFVVKPDNTVEVRQVQTSVQEGEFIVVDKGLSLGETVVTDGQLNLRSGSLVSIKNVEEKAKDKP